MGYSRPPKTWDEFGEMVCRFARRRGTDGYQIRTDARSSRRAPLLQAIFSDRAAGEFTYNSDAAKVPPKAIQKLGERRLH